LKIPEKEIKKKIPKALRTEQVFNAFALEQTIEAGK
jgi:hypothetical protein